MKSRTLQRVSLPVVLALLLLLAACQSGAPVVAPPPADTVIATHGSAPAAGTEPVVVDNADPTFAVLSGVWGECWGNDCGGTPHGETFRYAEPECMDCQAQFSLRVASAGEYDVWAWWPAGEDRSTTTPFTIYHGGESAVVSVDQRNNGSGWYLLTTLEFTEGAARIVVGGTATGYANADAVALTPAGTGEPPLPGAAREEPAAPTPEPAAPSERPGEVTAATPSEAPSEPTLVSAAAAGPIVVDYTASDISRIPDYWLERARELTVHFAHTSHGSQIVTGLEWLAARDPRYAARVRNCATDLGLAEQAGALRLCDGNPPDDYVTPDLYWSTPEGLARTQVAAESGLFSLSAWAWCGEQSDNDVPTVQQYLDALDSLERSYPGMRFIYMTGHTDGGGEILARNNDIVREYVRDNGKVLFDFASFEMYDPAGQYYPEASDACVWCEDWCASHPGDCDGLDQMGDCAHTHPLQCKLKAQAFWWLMARLAGWDGNP